MINKKPEERIILALDVSSSEYASEIQEELGDLISFYKIGMELFASGLSIENSLHDVVGGGDIFLDLKLPNDIPKTIEKTINVISNIAGIKFLSISDSATKSTIEAAVRGRGKNRYPKLLMVVNLSSDNVKEYAKQHNTDSGFFSSYNHMRIKMDMADSFGIDGFIASGEDIAMVRSLYPKAIIVSPGIRPIGRPKDDHRRVCTPKEAIQRGADYLVIGRPIMKATDKVKTIKNIIAEIKSAEDSE